jgi:hypothetical protein
MGSYFGSLPFLSDTELEEFNSICYSGKNTKGIKMGREEYLNTLGKGVFDVTQTKFDNGNFSEGFTIVWVRNMETT